MRYFIAIDFNSGLEYSIRKFQENVVGLELIGIHQLFFYADDYDLLGGRVNTIKENSETLLKATMDSSVEINIEKTKYMIISCYPNSGQH
jgi:hypothetical protein